MFFLLHKEVLQHCITQKYSSSAHNSITVVCCVTALGYCRMFLIKVNSILLKNESGTDLFLKHALTFLCPQLIPIDNCRYSCESTNVSIQLLHCDYKSWHIGSKTPRGKSAKRGEVRNGCKIYTAGGGTCKIIPRINSSWKCVVEGGKLTKAIENSTPEGQIKHPVKSGGAFPLASREVGCTLKQAFLIIHQINGQQKI